jgi:hypothetical protein
MQLLNHVIHFWAISFYTEGLFIIYQMEPHINENQLYTYFFMNRTIKCVSEPDKNLFAKKN